MGVIKKQSISGAIYSYIGVALGFVITGLLFPRLLSTEEIGLLRILVSYSVLLAQFAILGMNAVTVKMFPYFRNEQKKHHGYLGLLLMVAFTGFLLTTLVYLLGADYVINDAKEKSQLFISYYYYMIPIFFFALLFNVFDSYYRVLYNATIGIIYREIVQRILVIFSVLMFYFGLVDFHVLVTLYITAQIIPGVMMAISLLIEKQFFLKPDFGFLNRSLVKHIASVAFFGIITGYSGVLIMNIDMVMINHYLGLSDTGIYSITFFFGMLILIPERTLNKISAVVIADSWKKNDRDNILDVYKKSTLLLPVAGVFIFVGIWANIDNVFRLIGNSYEPGKYVIFFISLANIIAVYAGSSTMIISNSKHYKWLSLFLVIYTLCIILSNIIFIPLYGIIGAAFASFISRGVYLFLRFVFLKKTYGFQPYSFSHVLILIIGVFVWYLSTFIPYLHYFILDIFVRSFFVSIMYVLLIYLAKVSEDFNLTIDSVLRKLK